MGMATVVVALWSSGAATPPTRRGGSRGVSPRTHETCLAFLPRLSSKGRNAVSGPTISTTEKLGFSIVTTTGVPFMASGFGQKPEKSNGGAIGKRDARDAGKGDVEEDEIQVSPRVTRVNRLTRITRQTTAAADVEPPSSSSPTATRFLPRASSSLPNPTNLPPSSYCELRCLVHELPKLSVMARDLVVVESRRGDDECELWWMDESTWGRIGMARRFGPRKSANQVRFFWSKSARPCRF